jgi:ABC-type transport system substrate-binding protein
MMRSVLLALATSLALVSGPATAQKVQAGVKSLRYAFRIAETGFDPPQITDLYSRTVAAGLFEAPLEFEFLASPPRLRANTTVALPEVSPDFRTFTFRIKPGIHFTDDPVFKGAKRELTAADYVYSIKRHYDRAGRAGRSTCWRTPRSSACRSCAAS